jgi:threonine dehydrogenase-like Zn-dependent dehydrogenase
MAARIVGCDPIMAFDPLPSRLVLARELGLRVRILGEIFARL